MLAVSVGFYGMMASQEEVPAGVQQCIIWNQTPFAGRRCYVETKREFALMGKWNVLVFEAVTLLVGIAGIICWLRSIIIFIFGGKKRQGVVVIFVDLSCFEGVPLPATPSWPNVGGFFFVTVTALFAVII
jgi:hypothetical protein